MEKVTTYEPIDANRVRATKPVESIIDLRGTKNCLAAQIERAEKQVDALSTTIDDTDHWKMRIEEEKQVMRDQLLSAQKVRDDLLTLWQEVSGGIAYPDGPVVVPVEPVPIEDDE